ncbi:hypothetical protein [Serratia sp. DD3]|nr:hypothetical protein [Serratia sp. DD3]
MSQSQFSRYLHQRFEAYRFTKDALEFERRFKRLMTSSHSRKARLNRQ